MEPQKKEETSDDFGKVIDVLHNKQKLPSLRTYQGDVSNFIKEKNESVISIAVKEKHRDHLDEAVQTSKNKKSSPNNFQINFTVLAVSIALIVGGMMTSLYILDYANRTPIARVSVETDIIPINKTANLANTTRQNLGPEMVNLSTESGITSVKISNTKGEPIEKSGAFLDLLGTKTDLTLRRTLRENFLLGTFFQNGIKASFLIITVSDYGRAFSGMLEWEENMSEDLAFLNPVVSSPTASTSSTASTTKPVQPEIFVWKDLIVKNKDTRALVNSKNQAKLAYTFLDKNTLLIVNNISAIGEISSIYASRSVVR